MSLQDDVNNQVETIHAKLSSASAAAGEIVSTPVDLSDVIEEIDDAQEVDNGPVSLALLAICDTIDAIGGDTLAAREAIVFISNGDVSFGPVKDALTAIGEIAASISTNVDHASQAAKDHIEGGVGMVSLLIDQSNFDGVAE